MRAEVKRPQRASGRKMGRNGFAGRSVYQSANDGQGRLRSTILQINSWGGERQ